MPASLGSAARAVAGAAPDDADEGLGGLVVALAPPHQRDRGRWQVGDDPLDDVLALEEPGHGHRQQHDPGAGGHGLDGLLLAHRRPVELVGARSPARSVWSHQLLVDEVVEGHLVGGRDQVVAPRDDDRQLVVQPDAVQLIGVDGKPYQRQVDLAGSDHGLLVVLGDRDELEPTTTLLAPGARPLVRRRPGHECHPQRLSHGTNVGGQDRGSVIVTLRFSWRPASVALLAIGSDSPCPTEAMVTGTPSRCDRRMSETASARRWDSSMPYDVDPMSSVNPST